MGVDPSLARRGQAIASAQAEPTSAAQLRQERLKTLA